MAHGGSFPKRRSPGEEPRIRVWEPSLCQHWASARRSPQGCTVLAPARRVFFSQSKAFIETRDPLQALAGNAPIIINRFTNDVRCTGTARRIEHYLAEYEATLPSAQKEAAPERREH